MDAIRSQLIELQLSAVTGAGSSLSSCAREIFPSDVRNSFTFRNKQAEKMPAYARSVHTLRQRIIAESDAIAEEAPACSPSQQLHSPVKRAILANSQRKVTRKKT